MVNDYKVTILKDEIKIWYPSTASRLYIVTLHEKEGKRPVDLTMQTIKKYK